MKIASCVACGNGANIVHKQIAKSISGYQLWSYNPKFEYTPFLLPFLGKQHTKFADIIHTTPDNGLFFHRANRPLVLTAHGYFIDKYMQPFSSNIQRLHYATDLKLFTHLSLKKADVIVCVSSFIQDILQQHHHLNITGKTQVIYNGIDQTKFYPVEKKRADKKFKVLFSGNLTLKKGVQWVHSIAAKLKPHIEIYYTAGLRNYPELNSLDNMVPIGHIPHDDMPNVYRKMDLLFAPTVREGFGLGVAEAMASGLPVVASNCSAIPELVVDGEGGILCSVGDVDAFASAINKLASDPVACKQMGDYNREKIVNQFTLTKMVDAYQELFVKILDGE